MWQITTDHIAEITLTTGDSYEYLIKGDQLEMIRKKMHDGLGSLELVPNFGVSDEAEILNVRAVARVQTFKRQNYRDALVQLWCDDNAGVVYIIDPDDDAHVWEIDVDTAMTPGSPGEPVGFGSDAYNLVEGNLRIEDIAKAVDRPDPLDVDMVLVAAADKDGRVTLVAKPDNLNAFALRYLGAQVLEAASA